MPRSAARSSQGDASFEGRLIAAGRGDAEAFVSLYDATAPRVHGLVLRILRDPHQTEEVTQEVFVQVWLSAARFDPRRGTVMAWMMTIAHCRAIDRVRATVASRRRDEALDLRCQTMEDQTATVAHAAFDAQDVRAALAALTPLQRQALELAYVGGHTYAEVSRLTQVPLGTAKSRIRDGLLQLRDLLSPALAEG